MLDRMYSWEQGLHANVFDLLPDLISWRQLILFGSFAIDVFQYWSQRSFMADVISVGVFILLKSWLLFIDCIVCEVHAQIV